MRYLRRAGTRRTQQRKVFCIGPNKTGTTSLQFTLRKHGYKVGDQTVAELLIHEYARREFTHILEYCNSAQAFQDVPFSLPFTYQVLDQAFPESKFILSVRRSADDWYQSQLRFHMRRLGVSRSPTKSDMQNDPYRYRGWLWDVFRIAYNVPDEDPFNEANLKHHYIRHVDDVVEYFRYKDNLLVINLAEPDSYDEFCSFLGLVPILETFPRLNASFQEPG